MTPTPPTKASVLIIRHLISAPPHRDYGTAGFFFLGVTRWSDLGMDRDPTSDS